LLFLTERIMRMYVTECILNIFKWKFTRIEERFSDYTSFGKIGWNKSNFEKHITQNGTIVLKFFCIWVKKSRGTIYWDEEKKTQLEVLSRDLKERERWDDYMHYYEEAINNTSSSMRLGM
jgi:polyphosphate kinase 2 (PPK2 family)